MTTQLSTMLGVYQILIGIHNLHHVMPMCAFWMRKTALKRLTLKTIPINCLFFAINKTHLQENKEHFFKKTILLLYVKKKFKKSLYILTPKNSRSLLSTTYTAQSLYCKVNHCLLLLPSLFCQETTSALQKWYKDCSSYRPASCVPSP